MIKKLVKRSGVLLIISLAWWGISWPALAATLPLQNSVSKDGITWTFSTAVPVGQFVTGDYYVVGQVTVTSITPAPQTTAPYMNGSVLNLPTSNGYSSFDQRLDDGVDQSWNFDARWRVYAPITLHPGDALVSSISLDQIHTLPEVMRSQDKSCSPVRSVSILTVLNQAVSADAFRPAYCDRSQTIYYANNLQRGLLPSLAPPNPANTPPLSQFEDWFRRPWIDLNRFLWDAPGEYMPSYSQHIAFAVSYAGLLLALNFPADQKVNLTNYLVQYGIDLYGCLKAGYDGWPAFGGHGSGRKYPIIFAGILLNDSNLKNVSNLYPDKFGEDMQTIYVNQVLPAGTYQQAWQGATVIYGGHYGVLHNGTPVESGLYGPYEHLQPRDWPLIDNSYPLGEAYRRCCTSVSWVGEALAMRLLSAQGIWNHPAFFDYVDRWMTENDDQAVAQISAQTGFDYSDNWLRQGQTRYWLQGGFPQVSFIDDMWSAYRTYQVSPTPIISTTPVGSSTPTRTLTRTRTITPTRTLTPILTATPTLTQTSVVSPPLTRTITRTGIITPARTRTATVTITPTRTQTSLLTAMPTFTQTPRITATPTLISIDLSPVTMAPGKNIIIFPNPAEGRFVTIQFQTQNNSRVEVFVYNVAGRLVSRLETEVQAVGSQTVQYEIDKLANGMYLVNVRQAGKSLGTQRLVVKRNRQSAGASDCKCLAAKK